MLLKQAKKQKVERQKVLMHRSFHGYTSLTTRVNLKVKCFEAVPRHNLVLLAAALQQQILQIIFSTESYENSLIRNMPQRKSAAQKKDSPLQRTYNNLLSLNSMS